MWCRRRRLGPHAWSCKHAAGRIQRHHALNDVIARALTAAGIPVSKEPSGLFHNDDVRRPDGITLVPWQAGKAVAWDVTVASTHWLTPMSERLPPLQRLQQSRQHTGSQ